MSTNLETRPNMKAVRSYTATSTPPISITTVPRSRVLTPPFTEEEPRPENGEDGTELEEHRDISDEAKGNRREPEEWGDSCKQDGLLGPQTKFTTLRSQNTALVETTNNAKPDVRTLVLRSARGAVAPAASWVPASRSDGTHAD